MLGLASRRWAVNKLCQTFSIKAFRADNSEKYLTNNNNSSERELCGWVALLFSVCKWGQYLSASCFVLISSCSEISFMIDRQLWAPLGEGAGTRDWQTTPVMLTSETRGQTKNIRNKYNTWRLSLVKFIPSDMKTITQKTLWRRTWERS